VAIFRPTAFFSPPLLHPEFFSSRPITEVKEKIVRFQIVCKRVAAAVFAAFTVFAAAAIAQQPLTVTGPAQRQMRVAERNNVYCAGDVQATPIDKSRKLIRAVEEQEQFVYSQNQFVYINAGENKGVKVGDVLSVVRPRGKVNTRWSHKGSLGYYTQEIGNVEVIRVKPEVSVARVKTSCDNFLLGDVVLPMEDRAVPEYSQRPALDLFVDPSGKAMGRLFMARNDASVITRDYVVYIDLGAEDNVKVGDYLTIFRPLGTGGPAYGDWRDGAKAQDKRYQTVEFSGSGFSSEGKDSSESKAVAKERRLRKVVGEMVILNVKEKTATAVITRTAQEIHTGDWVEVQ